MKTACVTLRDSIIHCFISLRKWRKWIDFITSLRHSLRHSIHSVSFPSRWNDEWMWFRWLRCFRIRFAISLHSRCLPLLTVPSLVGQLMRFINFQYIHYTQSTSFRLISCSFIVVLSLHIPFIHSNNHSLRFPAFVHCSHSWCNIFTVII